MKATPLISFVLLLLSTSVLQAVERPNILWLTSEDNGPHLGCYGDTYATTPHLDALALRGTVYLNCWSNVPVCAPARTAIITGMYPTTLGAQHMRSMVAMPDGFKMFPQLLREEGYYCTNNRKEDYNVVKPGRVWDESSNNAHWRNAPSGQPFFAVFNFTVTHESQIRKRPHQPIHEAANVTVPPYHPDLPQVRQDWAQYYDKLSEMDAQVGEKLKEIEAAGLADDTIVFYFADHGCGLPRHKRSPKNSGLHVPLIVHIPEKFAHLAAHLPAPGGHTERLVSFVDLAPTLLSLAGIRAPENMQGKAFLGPFAEPERKYIFGTRDRMDERPDMTRSVRDKRYIYVRHYQPHLPAGQHLNYQMMTPTTLVWFEAFANGELNEAQSAFWRRKPREELFDLQRDPFEIHDLSQNEYFHDIKTRMQHALGNWTFETRDTGYLPEPEMHARAGSDTIFEMAADSQQYAIRHVYSAAVRSTRERSDDIGSTWQWLDDSPDPAIMYWNLNRYAFHRPNEGLSSAHERRLTELLQHSSVSVQIVAAGILARDGSDDVREQALQQLVSLSDLDQQNIYTAVAALNTIDYLDEIAKPVDQPIAVLPRKHGSVHPRMNQLVPRLIEKILADLEE